MAILRRTILNLLPRIHYFAMKSRMVLPFARIATPNEIIIFGVCIRTHGAPKTAWIELHQSLRTNPKVTRLAIKLGIDRNASTGLLVNLWLWAIDHAEDGQLRRYTDEEVAEAVFWRGNPNELRCAMRDAGWEDSDGTIHDWEEYGIRLLTQARLRKFRWLKKKRGLKRTFQPRSEHIAGMTTVPNQPNQPNQPSTIDKEASADAVSAFTQHFTQALKTKAGVADPKLVKKAQGVVYAYLAQYPETWQELTTEVDVLPRGWEPTRYLAQVRVMVQQRTHEKLKVLTEGVAKG